MKKPFLLISWILLAYFLSVLPLEIIFCVIVLILSGSIFYLYIYSKKNIIFDYKLFVYLSVSYSAALLGCYCLLYYSSVNSRLLSIILIFFLLPTIALLGYRFILSLHCFIDCYLNKNTVDNVVQTNSTKGCSIVISTRNEPFSVCKMTFDSVLDLDYKAELIEIIVVDNSDLEYKDYTKWKTYVQSHKDRYGSRCKFIHRDGVKGFKPRNLDIASKYVSFDYVMFLDADSTVPKDAINVAIPEFNKNERLGFVTFLIESSNYNFNFATKVMSIFQNSIRYFNEFVGKYGYCNFQGHNAIWRKNVLDKIGSWEEYHRDEVMITEDIAAGFRCYQAGYTSKPIFLKTWEWVPSSLKEFDKMWLRWSFGGMQVMHKHLGDILLSRDITLRVKLDMLYLLFKVAVSGFPLFAMFLVVFPKDNIPLVLLINSTLIPLFVLSVWYYFYGYLRGGFFSKIYQIYVAMFMLSSYVFWSGIKAEINYYLKRPQGWKPTSKEHYADDSWQQIILDNLGKLIFSLVGLLIATYSLVSLHLDSNFYLYALSMLPSILLFANTILCVIVLGKSH